MLVDRDSWWSQSTGIPPGSCPRGQVEDDTEGGDPMKKSSVTTLVVGAAAFLAVGAAAASAQAKPKAKPATSTTRIPVTKETPGEVVSKVDTVRVTVTDTVRIAGPMHVDTVTKTNTVTR